MARYDQLPFYKAAVDLALYVETVVRTFMIPWLKFDIL